MITLDEDFGELAVVYCRPHCGIVRSVKLFPEEQAVYCQQVIEKYAEELDAEALITVDSERVRIRSENNHL